TGPTIAAAADTPMATMSVPVAELSAGIENEHRNALEALLAGYPVEPENVHLEEGVAHQVLVRVAEDLHIDFVVMGAVSRSGLKRIFVGSTAERALDRLPCDLIIIKRAGFEAPDQD